MPPRMRTQSAGRPTTESLGRGTGIRVGRDGRGRRPREGNDERVDDLNGQGNDQGMGANGGVERGECWECDSKWQPGSVDQKVKYTAGSFVGKALTWWNSQIRMLSQEVANHAMVRAGHAAYTDRFHELARLVPHLVTPKSKMIERYVYGLALQIRGKVAATEPKTIQKAVQISGALTDKVVRYGSIPKVEKIGNVGGPSKDKNG
ncbi:hypothetical protein Tco_0505308 [Tanacetum coccineum]